VQLRTDSDEPRSVLLITDNAKQEPRRDNPSKDTELPKRKKFRSDKDEPSWTKSSTDIDDARRAKARNDIEEPRCSKSSTDSDEPS